MSQSSENQINNFELRPRTGATQTDASLGQGMPMLPIADPPTEEPNQSSIGPVTQGPSNPVDLDVAARADAGYQANITPNTPGYTIVYEESFSFGIRLPFSNFINNLLVTINRSPGQLSLIGGWLKVTMFEVACRIVGVEPRVSLFAALFSVTHDNFQTFFSAHHGRNILVKKHPNKVYDKRLLTKWFFARRVWRSVSLAYGPSKAKNDLFLPKLRLT
ncbi:hypothetical protein LIER_23593 [Lithospermum erythrorhizon]|uniref:Uncharacterized protein n=1 Tax=Lithospermum erythrorhizon TaxID=34254 RepID=A0AAV3R297_LITER